MPSWPLFQRSCPQDSQSWPNHADQVVRCCNVVVLGIPAVDLITYTELTWVLPWSWPGLDNSGNLFFSVGWPNQVNLVIHQGKLRKTVDSIGYTKRKTQDNRLFYAADKVTTGYYPFSIRVIHRTFVCSGPKWVMYCFHNCCYNSLFKNPEHWMKVNSRKLNVKRLNEIFGVTCMSRLQRKQF